MNNLAKTYITVIILNSVHFLFTGIMIWHFQPIVGDDIFWLLAIPVVFHASVNSNEND